MLVHLIPSPDVIVFVGEDKFYFTASWELVVSLKGQGDIIPGKRSNHAAARRLDVYDHDHLRRNLVYGQRAIGFQQYLSALGQQLLLPLASSCSIKG